MIDLRSKEIVIVEGLKKYLTTDTRPCEVVRQNQVAKAPSYPYVSYTPTTLLSGHAGTYSQAEDGTLYKDALLSLSFTVQSDDQDEAMALALRIHAYFTAVAVTFLADNGITVRRVTGITIRDNLISIQYEYRNGLDITFGLVYSITEEDQVHREVIESINF